MLAIIGWLALVALCGYGTFALVATAWVSLGFTGRLDNPIMFAVGAAFLAAAWYGVAIITPFHFTLAL